MVPYKAAIFDLDGVLTQTAQLHAQAWKEMFDSFVAQQALQHGTSYEPFRLPTDYRLYVDGKPRDEGIKSFLASRRMELPDGDASDLPGTQTVWGLGNLKNQLYLTLLHQLGPNVYPSSLQLLRQLKAMGLKTAMVTSSRNGREVLQAAHLEELFDTVVDGVEAASLKLKGKPAPDTFLLAAKRLGIDPTEVMVFEDAISGVEAGAAGGFGLVVGVDRNQQAHTLKDHGADVVVEDLGAFEI